MFGQIQKREMGWECENFGGRVAVYRRFWRRNLKEIDHIENQV
jgi:hypothetical protein